MMSELPFKGVRIADFGWIFAIPHATAWLGTLGADVIRVETAASHDIARFLGGTDGVLGINRSGVFNSINFSKRSVALNLSRAEAQETENEIALKVHEIYYQILIAQLRHVATEAKIRADQDLESERVEQVKYGSTLNEQLI
jgi:hypothetical protein